MITGAVARASAATGLRLIRDGHTTEGASKQRQAFQPDRYGDRLAPVLFGWETADKQPDFGVDVAGLAGPRRREVQQGGWFAACVRVPLRRGRQQRGHGLGSDVAAAVPGPTQRG